VRECISSAYSHIRISDHPHIYIAFKSLHQGQGEDEDEGILIYTNIRYISIYTMGCFASREAPPASSGADVQESAGTGRGCARCASDESYMTVSAGDFMADEVRGIRGIRGRIAMFENRPDSGAILGRNAVYSANDAYLRRS